MNALYTSGHIVLRVGHTTADPALGHELVRRLAHHAIPTADPLDGASGWFDGLAVSGWRLLVDSGRPVDWVEVGRAVRRLHSIDVAMIPHGYPVPDPACFPWWDFDSLLGDVGPDIDAAALAGLRATVERHRDWSAEAQLEPVVCHGDVHPGNVMMTADGPRLLDWDLLCWSDPAWDHAMLTTLATRWGGEPGVYAAFAAGYGESLADRRLTQAIGELRNVAATLMRVRAARTDSAVAPEAERRLRFWRGDVDAPAWHAQ
jgi:aminoglycoside phosphotransferase (APT) family kinase protein